MHSTEAAGLCGLAYFLSIGMQVSSGCTPCHAWAALLKHVMHYIVELPGTLHKQLATTALTGE